MKKKKYTDKEIELMERSFEEGYAVAKRLYKPIAVHYVTRSDIDGGNITKPKEIKN